MKANVKFVKETRQNPLNTILIGLVLQNHLFIEKFSQTATIHPGFFRGWGLWADTCSVSLRMNTIMSRDQFKPMKISENLVVSYKYMLLAGWEVHIGKNCDQGLENAA